MRAAWRALLGGLHRACIAAAQRRWQLLLLCHAAA